MPFISFKAVNLSVFLLFLCIQSIGQSNEEVKESPPSTPSPEVQVQENTAGSTPVEKGRWLPGIVVGPGLMTFLGDIKGNKSDQPVRYRLGYGFEIHEKINSFLDLKLFALTGDLYGSKRTKDTLQNYHFRATTFSIGLGFQYNFYKPFYAKGKKAPVVTPYLGAGIEYLNFDSKADNYDASNKKYHYWSDGALMDAPEGENSALYSEPLKRDYNYETPLTQESSFAIPISGGLNFNISPKFNLLLGAAYHLTLTDNIDFIKTGGSDRFLFTSASIKWNLGATSPYTNFMEGGDEYSTEDFLALERDDTDKDGIRDYDDRCPGTPQGVQVNPDGCPLDDDKDGVPNYADLEANTPLGTPVDVSGTGITDEYIARKNAEEEAWMKATSAERVVHDIIYSVEDSTTGGGSGGRFFYPKVSEDGTSFRVKLGDTKNGIPADQVEAFMQVQDITTIADGETQIYVAGGYGSKDAAQNRMEELQRRGIKNPSLIALDKTGRIVPVAIAAARPPAKISFSGSRSYNMEFKVQLGAFSAKVPESTFSGIPSLTKETAPNGMTRYMGGSFQTYEQAVTFRNTMQGRGFKDAFVVALNEGTRVSISTPEARAIAEKAASNPSPRPSASNRVVYKVQVGLFKNQIPESLQKLYSTFPNLEKTKNPEGLDRYTAGRFNNYQEAMRLKEEIISQGVRGAFVVSFIGENQIPLGEALKRK